MYENRKKKKAKLNFKIYDVTNWKTNIYNTPKSQEVQAIRQGNKKYFLSFFKGLL